jgi:hypothetical protein
MGRFGELNGVLLKSSLPAHHHYYHESCVYKTTDNNEQVEELEQYIVAG